MKLFLLGLFVALATATPLPLDEEIGEPVELIVNGVPDGEPLEIGDLVDIKLKHHIDGELASASNLLYPLTAQGLADAAVAAENNPPVDLLPVLPEPLPELQPVLLPQPVLPGVVPEPVLLPEPVLPVPVLPEEIPDSIVLPEPSPEVVAPIFPPMPEIVDKPEVIEETQIPNGEIFNDGNVQVSVNISDQPGVFTTIKSWVQMFLNYFNNGVQTSQQII